MIRVKVPATSANCCIGFDCMGMALNWFGKFEFEKSEGLEISGCPKEYQNEENLVVQAFKKTCDRLHESLPLFHLHIDSTIPFARGLGSSATCIVAGIMACNAWFGNPLSKEEMLEIATEMEGHPDNVAPAIFGETTLCFMDAEGICMEQISSSGWYGLAMVPEYPISTHEARKVLPSSLKYFECCQQVAHALVFAEALRKGQEEILVRSCKDYLHEPYRKHLIQEYDAIHTYCESVQMPMWISGSGSTMLAMSRNSKKIEELKDFLIQFESISYKEVEISTGGAIVENE